LEREWNLKIKIYEYIFRVGYLFIRVWEKRETVAEVDERSSEFAYLLIVLNP